MDERLSHMVDVALRSIARTGPAPTRRELASHLEAVTELLREVGIFARDMERTSFLHCGDADKPRRLIEQSTAAERLCGRLVDPPRADNVAPMPNRGLQGIVILESFR